MSTVETPKSMHIVFEYPESDALAMYFTSQQLGVSVTTLHKIPENLNAYCLVHGFNYLLLHLIQFKHLGELLKLSTDESKQVIVVKTMAESREHSAMYAVLSQVGIQVVDRQWKYEMYSRMLFGSTRE